jgi:hypothetical protein
MDKDKDKEWVAVTVTAGNWIIAGFLTSMWRMLNRELAIHNQQENSNDLIVFSIFDMT